MDKNILIQNSFCLRNSKTFGDSVNRPPAESYLAMSLIKQILNQPLLCTMC